MEKIGQNFHIWLLQGPGWLTNQPPYGQPDLKISVFTPSIWEKRLAALLFWKSLCEMP